MDALGSSNFLNTGINIDDLEGSSADAAEYLAGLSEENTAVSIAQTIRTAEAYAQKLEADTTNGIESGKQQTHAKLMSNMFKNANLINY